MGTTGRSTGVHLHFDITSVGTGNAGQGLREDPNNYLLRSDLPIPPEITNLTQLSSTKVLIEGSTNGYPAIGLHTKCYYKWDRNINISDGNFDGVVSGIDSFTIEVEKPRKATYISVLPVQISDDKEPVTGEIRELQLQDSYPCIQILDDKKEILNATPYIYKNEKWQEVIPTIRTNSCWYELYNTDKERVK
jgi:murein DD-endopeptidase MepM/ murein hydrolase activator NlpD